MEDVDQVESEMDEILIEINYIPNEAPNSMQPACLHNSPPLMTVKLNFPFNLECRERPLCGNAFSALWMILSARYHRFARNHRLQSNRE